MSKFRELIKRLREERVEAIHRAANLQEELDDAQATVDCLTEELALYKEVFGELPQTLGEELELEGYQ